VLALHLVKMQCNGAFSCLCSCFGLRGLRDSFSFRSIASTSRARSMIWLTIRLSPSLPTRQLRCRGSPEPHLTQVRRVPVLRLPLPHRRPGTVVGVGNSLAEFDESVDALYVDKLVSSSNRVRLSNISVWREVSKMEPLDAGRNTGSFSKEASLDLLRTKSATSNHDRQVEMGGVR